MRLKAGRRAPRQSEPTASRPIPPDTEIAHLRDEIYLLETLMDNVPDTIYFKDRESRFTRINRYAAARYGIANPALAVGRTDADFFTEEHAAKALRDEQEIIRTGQPLVNVEEKETPAGGEVRWVSTTKLPLRDRDGNIVGTFGISRDITQRKKAEDELQRRAFYDPLTDLPNRALFLDRLQHLFQRARRALGNPSFALLYLDLDRFKAINDSLGHQAGDELLVGAARRLERCLRPADTLARLGGDEFTILLDEIGSEADATGVADRIREALATPFRIQGHEVFASASVGIATSMARYESPDDMLRDADAAMYRAKTAGRVRSQTTAGDRPPRPVSSLRLEADLRHALERREIVPHYQPIVDLESRAVVGFEVLARWRHPGHGLLAPALFVPLAEESGLMGTIDAWMLAEGCRQARAWQRRHPDRPAPGISVNISGRQLSEGGVAAAVERALGASGLDPTRLTLDITESALLHGLDELHRMHAMSVRLHLDDFGTGYSSLADLHRLPIDALKIDRSFVSRMDQARQPLAIVKSIASLAQNLGIEAVAVGVETCAQADALRALRCPSGQGFLFAKPLPADEAERLLD